MNECHRRVGMARGGAERRGRGLPQGRLRLLAGVPLQDNLLRLGEFADKARYFQQDMQLPATRESLLDQICHLRVELERLIQAH